MAQSARHAVGDAAEERALQRFAEIVGTEHVLRTPEETAEFRDPFQPGSWDDYLHSAVLQPDSVEQVQAIIRVAAETSTALWTNSQGRNNGYGGGSPRVGGSVTVNLRRMNRILEIDDELCYALVEPGVSFLQLDTELQEGGHPLMLSVPDIGWGSLVGNSLEHGITYMKYGQDFMAPCGMEVVTAEGQVLRTGMGGVPGSRSWNLYKRGFGPSLDQLFMQSNFGIVTKMGLWLQPHPEVVMPVTVTVPQEEDIVPLVDTLRRLLLDGTVAGVPCLYNTPSAAAMVSQRSDWYEGDGPMPEDVLDRIGRELGIGRWIVRISLWGDGPVVDHRFAKLKAAFEAIPGAQVSGRRTDPVAARHLEHPSDRVASGIPSLDLQTMAEWRGGARGGHMDFAPVVPLEGAEVLRFLRTFRPIVESVGLDFKSAIMAISERSAAYVSGANFAFDDEAEARLVYDTMGRLVEEAGKLGYGNYRAHLSVMDTAADQFAFNDHAYMRFVEKIKDAVDPEGILSPGKQGIWPARLRHRG